MDLRGFAWSCKALAVARTMSATQAVAFGVRHYVARTPHPKSKSCANLVMTKRQIRPANSGASSLRIRSLSLSLSVSNTTISAAAGSGSSLIGQTSKLYHDEEEVIQSHPGGGGIKVADPQIVRVGSVRQQLSKLINESLKSILPDESNLEILIGKRQSEYTVDNAMRIWSKIKGKTARFRHPKLLSQAIMKNLHQSGMIEKSSSFVKIVLSNLWIAERIQKMLVDGIATWAPVLPITRAVVDISSPNISEEMHVSHLRATIIGDCLSRMLEFSKVEVLRRNSVFDWSTQSGMLIEYLFEEFPNWEELGEQAIGDLQSFYKASKVKFDNDPFFQKRAQEAVVRLQGGDMKYRKAWQQICDTSSNEFDQVYSLLKIQLEEKGMIEISEGAKVIFVEGQKNPIIVVERDGGFNYSSSDMAALWYRLNEEKAQWIIYVTDVGQSDHFEFLFNAAKQAGWIPIDNGVPYPKASHVGLGLVNGNDGKCFRTCSSQDDRLVDLLIEEKNQTKKLMVDCGRENEWTAEECDNAAQAIEYGAIKYGVLEINRQTNYTFNIDEFLNVTDYTALYLLSEHAHICSIIKKSGKDIDELNKTESIQLDLRSELLLGLHLIQFSEIVEDACIDLLPNTLCEYLYNLCGKFRDFYSTCKVVRSEETSWLLLCEATAIVMRECFKLMGITPLYKS